MEWSSVCGSGLGTVAAFCEQVDEIADSIKGIGLLARWNDCQFTKKVCVLTIIFRTVMN
jgi:hypothetical protein